MAAANETWVLTFQSLPGHGDMGPRVKRLLKFALRGLGLKCLGQSLPRTVWAAQKPLFVPREHHGGCLHMGGEWCLPCQEVRRLQAENEVLLAELNATLERMGTKG